MTLGLTNHRVVTGSTANRLRKLGFGTAADLHETAVSRITDPPIIIDGGGSQSDISGIHQGSTIPAVSESRSSILNPKKLEWHREDRIDEFFQRIKTEMWPETMDDKNGCYASIDNGMLLQECGHTHPVIDQAVSGNLFAIVQALTIRFLSVMVTESKISLNNDVKHSFRQRAKSAIDFMLSVNKYAKRFEDELDPVLWPSSKENCNQYKNCVKTAIDEFFEDKRQLFTLSKKDRIKSFTRKLLIDFVNEQRECSVYKNRQYVDAHLLVRFQGVIQKLFDQQWKWEKCVIS